MSDDWPYTVFTVIASVVLLIAILVPPQPEMLEYHGGIPDWAENYARQLDESGGYIDIWGIDHRIRISEECAVSVADKGLMICYPDGNESLIEYWRISWVYIPEPVENNGI